MTAKNIYVVGAGGFGREVVDVVEAINEHSERPVWLLQGIFDDAPSSKNLQRLHQRNVRYLGPIPGEGDAPDGFYILGIGDPGIRRTVARRLAESGWKLTALVHPTAVIGSASHLGAGTVICAGAQVSTNVLMGQHVHVNPNVTIGHDAILEDFVSANPGSILSGEVSIGTGTLIGAGAVVLQGLSIGHEVTVGAAACVTRSLEASVTVVGVPARAISGAQ